MIDIKLIALILSRICVPLIIVYLCNLTLKCKVSFTKLSIITVLTSIMSSLTITYVFWEGVLAGAILLLVPFVVICLLFSDSFLKIIFIFTGMVIITCASELFSFGVLGGVFTRTDFKTSYLPYLPYVIHQLIMILFIFILGFIFIKMGAFILNNKNRKYIILVGIYMCIQTFNTFLYAYFWYTFKLHYFIGILYMSLPVLWLLFTFYFVINIKKYERQDLEREFIKEQLEMQKEYFTNLKTDYEQMRRLRHDFANFKDATTELFNSGQIVKGNELLDSLSSFINESTQIISSDNEAVDALIFHKLKTINEKGIRYDIQIKIPKDVFSDLDLCSLISNLLDNAIESNEKMDNSRYISLVSINKLGYLSFVLSNPFNDIISSEFKTTKADKENHGIGLKIIDSIIKKYDGYSFVSTTDNKFQQVVYLKLNELDKG